MTTTKLVVVTSQFTVNGKKMPDNPSYPYELSNDEGITELTVWMTTDAGTESEREIGVTLTFDPPVVPGVKSK